eukprot:6201952-Pleurochrysis_carterae.AAC.2
MSPVLSSNWVMGLVDRVHCNRAGRHTWPECIYASACASACASAHCRFDDKAAPTREQIGQQGAQHPRQRALSSAKRARDERMTCTYPKATEGRL